MKKILMVGLGVGIFSGIVSILLLYLLSSMLELSFTQLNPVSILIASIIVNLIGALIYTKLRQKTVRPKFYYGMITVGVALLLSIMDWAYPPEPHIADIANPIHATVATLSIILIPIWLRKLSKHK